MQDELSKHTSRFLLFDRDCQLCRNLAAFVKAQVSAEVSVLAWQDFVNGEGKNLLLPDELIKPANELRVWSHSGLLEGAEAWQELLVFHPGLEKINWLVVRLGLQVRLGRSLNYIGHRARKICFRCR